MLPGRKKAGRTANNVVNWYKNTIPGFLFKIATAAVSTSDVFFGCTKPPIQHWPRMIDLQRGTERNWNILFRRQKTNSETMRSLLLTMARDSATWLPSKPNNTVGLTHMTERLSTSVTSLLNTALVLQQTNDCCALRVRVRYVTIVVFRRKYAMAGKQ